MPQRLISHIAKISLISLEQKCTLSLTTVFQIGPQWNRGENEKKERFKQEKHRKVDLRSLLHEQALGEQKAIEGHEVLPAEILDLDFPRLPFDERPLQHALEYRRAQAQDLISSRCIQTKETTEETG